MESHFDGGVERRGAGDSDKPVDGRAPGALPDKPPEDGDSDYDYHCGVAKFGDSNHHCIAGCGAKILEGAVNRAVGTHQRLAADDVFKDPEEQPSCADEKDDQ